jgi:hypothetical protein
MLTVVTHGIHEDLCQPLAASPARKPNTGPGPSAVTVNWFIVTAIGCTARAHLGGPQDGPTVKVDPAYHQFITNAFCDESAYGQRFPDPDVQSKIMQKVYSKYPLPEVHF